MDKDDIWFILLMIILLGYVWGIPKEKIYDSFITILAALIMAGWLWRKKKG